MTRHFRILPSPLGGILLRADDGRLSGLFFAGQKYHPGDPLDALPGEDRASARVFDHAAAELAAYFDGSLLRFTVPLALPGTGFQQGVWQALREIPFGETSTYAAVARAAGWPPSHARAAGSAVGRNPVSVIVPCHRVLGSGGALTGYAGGPLRKQALLALEGVAGWAAPVEPVYEGPVSAIVAPHAAARAA